MIFHTAGNKEKKNIFIMNNEKNFFFDAVGWKSYCNTKNVVLWSWACWRWALGVLPLGAQAERAGRACWAREAGGHAWGARAWRAGRADGMGAGRHGRRSAVAGAAASWASVRERADGRGRAGGRQRRAGRAQQGRQARGLGAWAGQDCALGAPDLIFKPVFDSVFFLSQ